MKDYKNYGLDHKPDQQTKTDAKTAILSAAKRVSITAGVLFVIAVMAVSIAGFLTGG